MNVRHVKRGQKIHNHLGKNARKPQGLHLLTHHVYGCHDVDHAAPFSVRCLSPPTAVHGSRSFLVAFLLLQSF